MLPPGFRFERCIDGPGLYLGDRVVATGCPANYDPDPPWRVCMYPTGLPCYVFTWTETGAERYMAAWARKWEREIREAVGRMGRGFADLAPTGNKPEDAHHPRHRRSRRAPRIA